MNNIRNILFDLDGTLIESSEGIINSVLYALDKMGIKEEQPEELESFIGPPLIESFAQRYNLPHEEANNAVQFYREYFAEKGILENRVYDGIPELLASLNEMEFQLWVATSKPTIYSEIILRHHHLDHHFQSITGSELDHSRVGKTDIIRYILDMYKLDAGESIMIGDRKFDIEGAKDNGLQSVFVTYGHGDFDELGDMKPDYVVRSVGEILYVFLDG